MGSEAKSWTDDLPVCHATGAGYSTNQIYKDDGNRQENHKFNDRNFRCRIDENTFIYAIFTGHGGSRVAEIAMQRIAAEILLGQLCGKSSEDEVKDVLRQAFLSVENGYLDSIDNILARKAMLQCELEGVSQYEIHRQYKEVLKQLNSINEELSMGTSVVLALIYYSKLYVCNVGNCRALLCKNDENNVLRVVQISVDHNLTNQDEIARLNKIGLDVESLNRSPFFTTRCIGNYIGKSGYKDCASLSSAKSEPIIAQPEIVGGIPINDSCRFLLLMSGGLCKTLHNVYMTDSNEINKEIIQMTVKQFRDQSTLMGVSQATVHKVVQMHHDAYMREMEENNHKSSFNSRDDITLLVRNFNFPMPNAIQRRNFPQVTFNPITQLHSNSHLFDMSDSSTTTDSQYTNTNSSTSSNGIENIFDKNRRIAPYVSFADYYQNVNIAKANGTLPDGFDFD